MKHSRFKLVLSFVVIILSLLACSLGASHLEKARQATEEGDTTKALEEYSLALEDELEPADHFAVLTERGGLQQQEQNIEAALTDYEAALAITTEEGKPAGDVIAIYTNRAEIYTEQEDWAEVVANLDQVLASQSDNYEALARRGYAHLQLRNFEEAIADLKASLQGDVVAASDDLDSKGNLINAYYDLAQAMLDLGEYEEAVQYHTEALALTDDPDDQIELLTARGFAYSQLNDLDKALTDLNQAIDLDPEMALAYAYRSYIYSDQERYDDAIADASKAIELGSDLNSARQSSIVHARALAYLVTNEYEKAVADATQAIELAGENTPSTARTYNIRSQAYRWMGDYKRAINDATQAIELGTTDVTALDGFYRSRAWAYYLNDENAKALPDIEAAIELDDDDPNAYDYDLLGRINADRENYDEAITSYQQALNLNSTDPWIYNRMGDTYYRLEEWSNAVAAYQEAMVLDPEEYLFPENLGFTLNYMGQPEDAEVALLTAADLGSPNAWLYNELGDIYYDRDDLAMAETAYQTAIKVDTTIPLFHENLGLVLRQTERYEDSITSYTEALTLSEERPYSWLGRGLAHYYLSQDTEAIADLETVLLFDVNQDIIDFVNEVLADIQ